MAVLRGSGKSFDLCCGSLTEQVLDETAATELADAGFLTNGRRGRWACSRVDRDRISALCAILCP